MSVLTDLKARGVEDILIACTDNLKGFTDAIKGVFPQPLRSSASFIRSETVASMSYGKTEKAFVSI